LQKTKWSECVVRFVFGGAISVVAAIPTERFGPAFGGLFLAFPAIFPASATLMENMSSRKRLKRESRRRCAAGNPPRSMHSERR